MKITNKKLSKEDNKKIVSYLFENKEFLNVPDGSNNIRIYSHITELTKNIVDNYFLKENPPKIDSKIHPFETNNKTLFSMLYNATKCQDTFSKHLIPLSTCKPKI